MRQSLRYGDAQHEAARSVRQVSYNALAPKARRDASGQLIPCAPPPIRLGAVDVYRLLRQYLQGRGIVKPALWVILATNVLNVLFNYALIFGNLGMPELGLEGAGMATGLSRACMLIGIFWLYAYARIAGNTCQS